MLDLSKKIFKPLFRGIYLFFFFSFNLFAMDIDPSLIKQNDDEALFLRRIIDFFDEGNSTVVKSELEKYLQENSSSEFTDYLYGILGDIYFGEKSYNKSADNYSKISNLDIKENIFPNYIQSLYLLKRYGTLCQECMAFSNIIKASDKSTYQLFCYLLADSYYNQALDSTDEETKKSFASNAKGYMAQLLESPYEKEILEPLANVEFILKDYQLAASLLVKLADKQPEKRESFLFQAATMQMTFDKEEALRTFTQIYRVGKEKKSEAAFNSLILLVESERWSEIIVAKDQFAELLDGEQKRLFNFYLAKSYYTLQDFPRSASIAKEYAEKETVITDYTKSLLQMLSFLGQKLEDESLLTLSVEKYSSFFPEDIELANLYLARAIFYKNKDDFQRAKSDFTMIENKFYDFDNDNYLVQSAHLYYQINDFIRSRAQFKAFIDKKGDEKLLPLSLNYFINSSVKALESVPEDKKGAEKNILLKDLELYLSHKELLSKEEIVDHTIMLSQVKYELEASEPALKDLLSIYNEFDLSNRVDVNYLIALCYKKSDQSLLFCQFAEKALANDKDKILDEKNIRLCLFDQYLKKHKEESKEEYLTSAASNLFLVLFSEETSVDNEKIEINKGNMLWLADFYYRKVKDFMEGDWRRILADNCEIKICASRAILTLEKLLYTLSTNGALNKDNLFLEEDFVKLSELYGFAKENLAKKEILETLVNNYQVDLPFKFREKVYFELASAYLQLNEKNVAAQYFSKVISLKKRNYFNFASMLNLARLELSNIDEKNFKLDNPKVVEELSSLKNIKLQKNLKNEPLHLEAAIDYVEFQSKIESNLENKITLFMKVKQDFSENEDIISRDYQNSKKIYPEKEKIVKAYLTMIDAKILVLLAAKEKDEKYLLQAENLLKDLKEQNMIVSVYLENKIKEIAADIQSKKEKL